jgi:hypothetical protein
VSSVISALLSVAAGFGIGFNPEARLARARIWASVHVLKKGPGKGLTSSGERLDTTTEFGTTLGFPLFPGSLLALELAMDLAGLRRVHLGLEGPDLGPAPEFEPGAALGGVAVGRGGVGSPGETVRAVRHLIDDHGIGLGPDRGRKMDLFGRTGTRRARGDGRPQGDGAEDFGDRAAREAPDVDQGH